MSLREYLKEECLIIDESLENKLKQLKKDTNIKIKKDGVCYSWIALYGVYYNYWYLVAIKDDILNEIEDRPMTSENLKYRIDIQKEEMIDEDYEIEGLCFYCLNTIEEYKKFIDICLYEDSSIEEYSIKDVYVSDDELVLELY